VILSHQNFNTLSERLGCGAGLEYMIESFPPSKWLPKVFSGESECMQAAKHLILGAPIPVWAALGFVAQVMVLFGYIWFKVVMEYITRIK
jgi:disulfide bond formation protein DsbB